MAFRSSIRICQAEVSIHGETGLTVEPGDADALAQAMNWMYENTEQRLEFGVAARKHLEKRFTEQILVKNMKAVYQELMNGKQERN